MSLLVFGVNHKTAPVEIREKIAFDPEQLTSALVDFIRDQAVNEALILSTCNRTEVYCDVRDQAPTHYLSWLIRYRNLAEDELMPCMFSYSDDEAVRHLLRVACGLDSLVLGEPQILGQIKSAYQSARSQGAIGKLMDKLFQHCFSVAKQVRTDTVIGKSPISVAFAAVRLAQQIFADLSQHSALLIGAGETIELAAYHLNSNRLNRMIIANRSWERAQSIASAYDGHAISLKDIPKHLAEADIVISSTASQLPILGKGAVEQALRKRKHRPMFFLDIAVPRDIEPEVSDLRDVYLYTVDDLEAVIEENLRSRQTAARQADEIIAAQVKQFMAWFHSLDAVPTIRSIREQADQIRGEALQKARRQLARGDDPKQVLEDMARVLTNKLLHTPSHKLNQASAQGESEILKAARRLFDLDGKKDQ